MAKQPQGIPARELIIRMLKEKSFMKQEIFHQTRQHFQQLKQVVSALHAQMVNEVNAGDRKLAFQYQEKGDYEAILSFAGDTLIFHMHSNVFNFERSHPIWNTSYVREDETRAYCGVINIYNFLTDSFRYNRENDLGYMIARIFINREGHYFVEGKRQMGFLYNDFSNATISREAMERMVESAVLYTLDFDLLLPNYDQVKTVTISDIFAASDALHQKTGKRMGFRFQADTDGID